MDEYWADKTLSVPARRTRTDAPDSGATMQFEVSLDGELEVSVSDGKRERWYVLAPAETRQLREYLARKMPQ